MKTLIFDGHNAMWRIQKTVPELRSPKGQPVQVVYGLLRLFRSCIATFEPDRVLVCWDTPGSSYDPKISTTSSWRTSVFPGYKKNRRESRARMTREERRSFNDTLRQKIEVQKILPMLGIMQAETMFAEADDIIAMACRFMAGKKVIVSADKDMLQLVRKKVSVWSPMKKILYTHKNFRKKFHLTPKQYLEMRILTGDTSDEIPGVCRGIGEKTATTLLYGYDSIANIYANLPKIIKKGKRFEGLAGKSVWAAVSRNRELMDLSSSQMRPTLRKLLRRAIGSEPRIKPSKVKAYFLEHAFSSLLEDYASWIIPFRNLGDA